MTGRPGRHCRPGCSLPLPESLQARGWCETRRTGPGVGNPAGPCGGPGPSLSDGPIRRPPAAGAATYGSSAPRAALATEGARLERAPASLAGARRTGSVTRTGAGPVSGARAGWARVEWRCRTGRGGAGGQRMAGAGTEGARLVPTEAPRRPKSNLSATIGPGERNAAGLALLKTKTMQLAFNGATRRSCPRKRMQRTCLCRLITLRPT